jgi:hypothetical protein
MAGDAKIALPDIEAALLDAIPRAFKLFMKWSGGIGLGRAPESLLQVEVARGMHAVRVPCMTLEEPVQELLDSADAERRGRPPRGSRAGRIDVVGWWASETPRILVEVKRAWGRETIVDDARRLRQLLGRRGASFQAGYVVVYTDAVNKDTVTKRVGALAENAGARVVGCCGPTRVVETDGKVWYWGGAVMKVLVDE